jgi:hypothetical protein
MDAPLAMEHPINFEGRGRGFGTIAPVAVDGQHHASGCSGSRVGCKTGGELELISCCLRRRLGDFSLDSGSPGANGRESIPIGKCAVAAF